MKFGRWLWIAAGLAGCGAMILHGEIEPWVQHLAAGPAISALFKSVPMPGGAVPIRRPPAQTRPALTSLLSGANRDAMLYCLRAQESEMALDFPAAEADWKTYAGAAPDRYAAQIELADFYHRRNRPRDEVAALTAAASAPDDSLQPAAQQRGWRAFERMASVVTQENLPVADATAVFRVWVARYPKEPAAWQKLIDHLTASGNFPAAQAEIVAYGRNFHDDFTPVRMRADLEIRRGAVDAALAVYDRAFQPLWPDDLVASYFKMLEDQGRLREFTGRARSGLAQNPADLDATARLFRYFRVQNNFQSARRVLLEYRLAKESGRQPWTAQELDTAAQLFERLPDVNEAARLYYALYSAPPAGGPQAERALYGLANLLLTAPEQPIQFGSGDLSFYKDIATTDSSPGFLNGILSLVLNWTGPHWEYQSEDQKSRAYFHRAAAAQLVALLERRFPRSSYRDPLRAALISACTSYGDDATMIRAGREYLAAFPSGAARVSVAMQVSDALARANRSSEEFALYDQMLRELAAKASGVPIGSNQASEVPAGEAPPAVVGFGRPQFGMARQNANPVSAARSPEYVQVLDKYLSRLATVNRPLDALRVYRTEIDRNPNDPGLYQRLAAFLEQNGMSREVEDIYAKAIAKFQDRSWYDKLARWYLRRQEYAALEKISRDAIAVFSGSELEQYFNEVVTQTHPDAVLYRQLNLYAHARFPEDLVFVHNLLAAYGRKETADSAAAERLLREYWFYDPQFRSMLFERLSASGRLYPELSEIRAANPGIANGQVEQALAANPAAVQFVTEAEAWLGHFEAAAPAARALASAYPGKREFTSRASTLYRSLAAYDPPDTEVAVAIADSEFRANPRDSSILARMGDVWADREMFGRARTFWERMPGVQPAKSDGYLDTATVYWDYYRYDDALRWIAAARRKFRNAALFAYQAGAIYEGKRDYRGAVLQYVAGALDGEEAAERRLLRLLNGPQTRGLVDRATESAVASDPSRAAVGLRIAVLEREQRRGELEALLRARVEAEKSAGELVNLQETARRLVFDSVEERAAERLAAISTDPVDKMRLSIANARIHESKKDIDGGARIIDALYRDHPLILGVVRAAADYHLRNHQPGDAIAILLDASKHARTDLAAQFTLESARIATSANDLDRARSLLSNLLSADPLRAEYLAAMADTYLQAKDDRGFRDLEIATIQRLKQSPLAPAQRVERVAAIRRALIPALDRLQDSAGAIDQYIELINSYPEDEGLTREAAAYAVAHGQAPKLVAFYQKTITGAPLDYRWPIVLARIETVAAEFPAAIADYERAIKDRPDRAELFEAKGGLEERLMRFDDAVKTYTRLYELAYRDPQWMIKVAELQARSGRNADAVTALKTAVIGARSETSEADFDIAERLEAWQVPDAVTFAEHGVALAGGEFARHPEQVALYARILAKARRMLPVLARLGSNAAVDQQIVQQIAFAIGPVIAETYTPEEKQRFEQDLIAQAARMQPAVRNSTLLPLANASGLVDLEARWRFESISAQHGAIDQRFVQIQSERGLFGELGRQLEEYAGKQPGQPVEPGAWQQSVQAFVAEGDVDGELRTMRQALARNALSGDLLDRYLDLVITRNPQELRAVARGNPSAAIRNRAVQVAISSGPPNLAYEAIAARGAALPPVWAKAYTALAGRYFDDPAITVDAAFQSALDTRTIGERLRVPARSDSVILGTVWFYYGARYGEYLLDQKNAAADGWLPAALEAAPGNPDAYIALGDTCAEAGQPAKAIANYEHALELDPDRGDAHGRIALVLWSEGRHAEAVAQWKTAITTFLKIQSRGIRVPETFWGCLGATFAEIGQRHAISELHAEIAHLISDYYQRNHEYRLHELIQAAVSASIQSGDGTDWLVEMGRAMGDPEMIFNVLLDTPGLTPAQRIAVQRGLVTELAARAQSADDASRPYRQEQVVGARMRLIGLLLDASDVASASAEWRRLPARSGGGNQVRDELEIRLAAKAGGLDALLNRYRAQPETAASAETARNAALVLKRNHDENGARAVLEFVYDREIREGRLDAANFLGLAEVKLQRNDLSSALALLNRMPLVAEDGFETLVPAADLLSKYGKSAEAADFLRRRLRSVPWDSVAHVQLARLLPPGAERDRLLDSAVLAAQAPYRVRAEAASLAIPRPVLGAVGELALLSSARIIPDAATKPFQVEARIEAEREASDSEIKLRLSREALAIAPSDVHVRLAAVRAALTLHRDRLALSLAASGALTPNAANTEAPPYYGYGRFGRYFPYPARGQVVQLPAASLTDQESADLYEALSAAAERIGDLTAALSHLRAAIGLRPEDRRPALLPRVDALAAEQRRRSQNAARQPVIKDVIEQGTIVRPRILRSAQ